MKVYIDGEMKSREDARVSVFDHGLLYGDGVFEGIRVYGGRCFRLREHIERLYMSARVLMINIPMDMDAMAHAVNGTVAANGLSEGYVRLVVTRGAGGLGLDPGSCPRPTVIIIADAIAMYPAESYESGMDIVTAATRRAASDMLDPRVKSLNYLNNVMARIEAARAGCREAVMLNSAGNVAECTADNIFIVKGGALLCPYPSDGALEGITMNTVAAMAGELGIAFTRRTLTRYDLYTADECFLTGTGAEVVPVRSIDGRAIESTPGTVTRGIMREYARLVRAS